MRDFMTLTKALADENRVPVLLALRKQELFVCQITELFGLAPGYFPASLRDGPGYGAGRGARGVGGGAR